MTKFEDEDSAEVARGAGARRGADGSKRASNEREICGPADEGGGASGPGGADPARAGGGGQGEACLDPAERG